MFTLQQIKTAHAKVKSGADFPRYIQEIKQLGLLRYEFMVTDGSFVYYGEGGYRVEREGSYAPLAISRPATAAALREAIAIHQKGQTDFPTFCRQAAAAGVEKWEIDTQRMMCTYFSGDGMMMVEEPIPQGEYACN
ncbi:MAG TPA: DUF1398 family protein [Puia sp.]|nr:DUF1398 family protein [Puia sp.]